MKIQKIIEVGLLRKRPLQVVELVQHDTGIQLVFIVADFEIPAGTTAMLYVQKPSGKFVYQEAGITVSSNSVTVDLENQALTEYGVASYQLQLTNGENRISTFAGILRVEKSLAEANAEESKSVITGFDKAITKRVTEFVGAYLKENPVSDGKDGATFTPSLAEDGTLSWTNDKGMENPGAVNIMGPHGKDGNDGQNGKDGKDGTSITVSSVAESTEDGGNNVVTFSDGKQLVVKNGNRGGQGAPYTLTDTDMNTIAAAVKASLTTEPWICTLEDGSTVTKAVYVG